MSPLLVLAAATIQLGSMTVGNESTCTITALPPAEWGEPLANVEIKADDMSCFVPTPTIPADATLVADDDGIAQVSAAPGGITLTMPLISATTIRVVTPAGELWQASVVRDAY
jgi:hypothetical protein